VADASRVREDFEGKCPFFTNELPKPADEFVVGKTFQRSHDRTSYCCMYYNMPFFGAQKGP